ncbi:hypothetical protein BPAE_0005g00760 [Botrytis paeoniae]|uniref:Uncharacterized protein n=1 Tax=Botrytis paeoniae TaxID=278948 RepID=A0A4Z1G4M8_9HELO|nr:hypothetical protein BPAE_0005g00760 [Botrytis paeoniae]
MKLYTGEDPSKRDVPTEPTVSLRVNTLDEGETYHHVLKYRIYLLFSVIETNLINWLGNSLAE